MSDKSEDLYCNLEKLMDRIRLSMHEDADPEILLFLAEEQKEILSELQQKVDNKNFVMERGDSVNRQVSRIIGEIQHFQQEISTRIKQASDGKKMVKAYVT